MHESVPVKLLERVMCVLECIYCPILYSKVVCTTITHKTYIVHSTQHSFFTNNLLLNPCLRLEMTRPSLDLVEIREYWIFCN